MRRTHLWVLLLFTLLAAALTLPLVTRLTTHVPGSDTWAYDEYTFLWNIWSFKYALIDELRSPLATDLIFFPVGMGLVMYTFSLMAAALALPIHLATGNIPLSYNLVNLLSTVLGGYGTYLLVRYLLRRRSDLSPFAASAAAVLAGLVYAFASSRSIYLALGHAMIVTTQWVPFFALSFVRLLDRWRTRDALLAGLFLAFALLTDMLYGVLLGLIAGVLLVDWWLSSRKARRAGGIGAPQGSGWQRLGQLALMAAFATLLSAPLLIPTLREGFSADYAVEGWGHAEKLSADLAGLVTPTDLHPVFGSNAGTEGQGWIDALRAVETGTSRFRDVNTVFAGWATLALAVLGASVGGRRSRAWLAIALLAGLLALGPLLQINGRSLFDLDGLQVTVPLPYVVVHYLPFIKGFRAPNRFSIVLMQALAVLAGFGTAWLIAKVSGARVSGVSEVRGTSAVGRRSVRWWGAVVVAVVLAGAVVFEHLAIPMPLTDARVPAPYRALAQEPGDFTLMQLPMGWRNGFGVFGAEDTRVEWYQSVHGKPILGGNTSRNPAFKLEYFKRLPLLQAITGLEQYQAPDAATDQAARASAAELMALWNVRYLVVNPPVPQRYPYADTWQTTRDYVLDVVPLEHPDGNEAAPPQPVWDEDGVQVYAVRQPPVPFPFELDLGSRDTNAYRGPGWSGDEADIAGANGIWVDGDAAELYLPLRFDDPQPLELVLRVQPFDHANAPQQTLSAEFNGVALGEQPLAPGWQELRLAVPAEATRSGLNRLWLHFGHSARPVDVLPGQGTIGSTGVALPVDVEINSGGAAQDIAYITVTNADGAAEDASAGRRGYNLTAVDPRSGKILDKRGFDTWANTAEADRLADFVERLPAGTVVLGAVRDDASRFLTDRAVAALASLGSAVDLRTTPGYGHALIGVKGAAAGAAAEATGQQGAYLRLAPDRRSLAAAVDWVRLEPAQ
jgi:hypothetical protein